MSDIIVSPIINTPGPDFDSGNVVTEVIQCYPIIKIGESSFGKLSEGLKLHRERVMHLLEKDLGGEPFVTIQKITSNDPTATLPGMSISKMIFTNLEGERQRPHTHICQEVGGQYRILLGISNNPMFAAQELGSIDSETKSIGKTTIPPYTLALYVVDGTKIHWFGYDKKISGETPDSVAVVFSMHLIDALSTGADPMRLNTQLVRGKRLNMLPLEAVKPTTTIEKLSLATPEDVNIALNSCGRTLWQKAAIAYAPDGTPTPEGLTSLAEILRQGVLKSLGKDPMVGFGRDAEWMLR